MPVSAIGMTCQAAPGAMTRAHRPRVLVIDDDPVVRNVVCALLAAFGYDYHSAADGPTGLLRFDEGGWDLVLTDLVMPQMSGWDVIETIRRRAPTMPIIAITAHDDPAVIQRATDWQVPVILKPFHWETLNATIIQAIHKT
jgi:CheY-like chemotaxis protein